MKVFDPKSKTIADCYRIVSVDPGKNKIAYACWNPATGELIKAGLVTQTSEPGTERVEHWREIADYFWVHIPPGDPVRLVVEIPQIYSGPREEDPNDLIDLAGVVGAICSSVEVEAVEWSPQPREWKGQIPKAVTKTRVDKRLSEKEKALVEWPAGRFKHDVYDALHLGLVFLEREGLRKIPDRYPESD